MSPKLPVNIKDLLNRRTIESERIEYKKGWNPVDVVRSLSAFANDFHNLGGGYIVIGVEEVNGQPILPPVGLKESEIDSIQKELFNLGHSAIQPDYHAITATYEIDGKTILVLWSPGGETRPYKARVNLKKGDKEWAYYIRKNTSTQRAKGKDEEELISLAAKVPFDDRYHQTATINDLSYRLMCEFLNDIQSELTDEAKHLSVEALAQRMNIVGGPPEMLFPKNVGLLFFNDNPEKFFPVTQIDVVYFPDGAGGDSFEEKVFKGPLGQITQDALDYIDRNYLTQL